MRVLFSCILPNPPRCCLRQSSANCEVLTQHPVPARAWPSWLKELKCCSSCFRPPPGSSSRSSSRALQQSCKMNGPAQPSSAQPAANWTQYLILNRSFLSLGTSTFTSSQQIIYISHTGLEDSEFRSPSQIHFSIN